MKGNSFVVMVSHAWDIITMTDEQTNITYSFEPGTSPIEGCVGFMPIFGDKESAEKWADGRYEVAEIRRVKRDDQEHAE